MTENKVVPEVLELIRRTSAINGFQDVYSLAPRGYRVGFYFQMRRAVLLVKALEERYGHEELKKAKIAIIGAGATGVMAFLALRSMQAEHAYLYEASESHLNTASLATHRLVHPTYNRWPMLGSMDPFTSMPLINWFADNGEEVAKLMREQIDNDPEFDLKGRINCLHRCVSVAEKVGEAGQNISVEFNVKGKKKTDYFNIVLICVGFGGELGEDWGLEDYWTKEEFELDVDEHRRPVKVFGTGDGALIDILRCCARDPKLAWELPLRLIAALRDDKACTLQMDKVSDPVDPRRVFFTDVEKKIQRHEERLQSASWSIMKRSRTKWVDRTLRFEEEFYRSIVRDHFAGHSGSFDFLEAGLKPVASEDLKPKLYGDIETPFMPTSSPVNKLLLAYLIETGRVEYKCVERIVSKRILDQAKKARVVGKLGEIIICRYGPHRNFPVGSKSKAKTPVRVYPGKRIPKEVRLESELIDMLSGMSGGEYVYFDAMPHPLTLARNGDNLESINDDTRKRFTSVIEKFAKKYLAAKTVRLATNEKPNRARHKWVVETGLNADDVQEALRKVGGIDGVFCGAAIVLPSASAEEEKDF